MITKGGLIMPNTLVLNIRPQTTKEKMLAAAQMPGNPSFLYTYTLKHTEPTESEQKENREPISQDNFGLGLTSISIFSDTERWRRLSLFFASEKEATSFMETHRHLNLPFYQYQIPRLNKQENCIGIISNILTPLPFKHLKSIFIHHFNIDEENVEELFSIAHPLPQASLLARENIKSTFNQRVASLFPHILSSSKLKTDTYTPEHLEHIKMVSQTLIKEAQAFDTTENLEQNAITLALGNLFLSFNLQSQAIEAFNNIKQPALEYYLAQTQLASIYMSRDTAYNPSNTLKPSLESSMPIASQKMIVESFIAALNAKEPTLAAAGANILSGFDQEKDLYTSHDFEFLNRENTHPIGLWLKSFSTILEQQEENKRLKSQLESVTAAVPVPHVFENIPATTPITPAIFHLGLKS